MNIQRHSVPCSFLALFTHPPFVPRAGPQKRRHTQKIKNTKSFHCEMDAEGLTLVAMCTNTDCVSGKSGGTGEVALPQYYGVVNIDSLLLAPETGGSRLCPVCNTISAEWTGEVHITGCVVVKLGDGGGGGLSVWSTYSVPSGGKMVLRNQAKGRDAGSPDAAGSRERKPRWLVAVDHRDVKGMPVALSSARILNYVHGCVLEARCAPVSVWRMLCKDTIK